MPKYFVLDLETYEMVLEQNLDISKFVDEYDVYYEEFAAINWLEYHNMICDFMPEGKVVVLSENMDNPKKYHVTTEPSVDYYANEITDGVP